MKAEIDETISRKTIITTCDECGKEIGRNHRGDYEGYCCSVCSRQYCHECHKSTCIEDTALYLHYCKRCQDTSGKTLIKMKQLLKVEETARKSRFKLEEKWKARSLNPSVEVVR